LESVSLIIPSYNEEEEIANAIACARKALKGFEHEIIVADGGSTDRTCEIVLLEKDKRVKLLRVGGRGKGLALSLAIKSAKGSIAAFMDADLSSDIGQLGRLIDGAKKADISIGSRLEQGAEVRTGNKRNAARVAYNFFVRLILGSKVSDHQCGFKAFRRKKILSLLDEVKDTRWFWDTELLVLAQRKGLSIDEFPVKWKQGKTSRVSVFWDSLGMFEKIIEMRVRLFFMP
jgi:glycosyltransferase AglD